MKFYPSSRRAFLQGAGLFALSIPFLPSLVRRAGAAPAPQLVRRLVAISSPYGQVGERFFPAESVRSMQKLSERASVMALTDIVGDLSPVFRQETFGPLLGKMLFFDGLDSVYSTGHSKSYPLTGYVVHFGDGELIKRESIDQTIAAKAPIYDSEPTFRSMNLACGMLSGTTHAGPSISYKRQGDAVIPVPQTIDPSAVWDLAFKDIVPGAEGQKAFEQLKTDRLSLIDRVHEDYSRVRNSPRLSHVDGQKLDQYMAYLRELEQSVSQSAAVTCTPPTRPDLSKYPEGKHQIQDFMCADQVSNIVHLLRCGLTNVVTLSLEATSMRYANLGVSGDHHGLSHGKDSAANVGVRDDLETIARFQAEHIASLAKQLDAVEDPATGRTLLDDTLIVWTSDMGSTLNHKGSRHPVVMLGGTGSIRQNALLDFRSPYTWNYATGPIERIGISYNNVLVAISQLMGLEPDDYEQGQAGIGDYHPSKYFEREFPSPQAYDQYAFGDRKSFPVEMLAAG